MKPPIARRFFAAAALLLFLALLSLMLLPVAAKADAPAYVTDRAGLMKALADKTETVYLGDIEFDENDIFIQLGQSVNFVGKPGGSVLKNVRFSLVGPEVESELITISFTDLVFDGGYRAPEGDPEKAASFAAFHGDRTNMGCFYAQGYLDVSFSGCTFRGYCCSAGAGIYLNYTDGNKDIGTRAKLTMTGCRFTDNIGEKGILWCNGKNTKLELTDTVFENNTVNSGVVMLGGVNGTVDGLVVRANRRVVFAEKNSFPSLGGALALAKSDVLIRNSRFEGAAAVSGGGVMAAASLVTFDSCVFADNFADEAGGAIRLNSHEAYPIYVTNCVFRGNRAREEGAVYVIPADQIGIGLPNGITEFSFCTFEDNRSDEGETFVFHPVQYENPVSTVGRDGTIDFIACRITDDRVTDQLKTGDRYNIVNSDEKGPAVPDEVVKAVANGYYRDAVGPFFAGVNEREPSRPDGNRPRILIPAAIAVGCLAAAGTVWGIARRKKPRKPVETPPASAPSPAEDEPAPSEECLRRLARENDLTKRELEVLTEYVAGKSRAEIGRTLFISESTVKNHISSIFAKLGVTGKKELIARLRRLDSE